MAAPKRTVLDDRIDEVSFKLLIIKEKIRTLTDEQHAIERELSNLSEIRARVVNPTRDDSPDLFAAANPTTAIVNRVLTTREPKRGGVRPGSIKEAALRVLLDQPDGLLALDILRRINADRDDPIPRTSLSPQLSRLAQNGLASQQSSIWKITPRGAALLKDLGQ